MAHPTMDATAFVKLWIRRFEKLIWMPVSVVCGKGKGKGKVEWFFTAETREEEEDLLTDDEEFEGGGDGEGDEDEEDEEGDEDEDGEGVEADVAGDEIDGLWEDAYGESEWRQRRNEVETQGNKDAGESVAGPSPDTQSAKERHLLDTSSWDAKTRVSPVLQSQNVRSVVDLAFRITGSLRHLRPFRLALKFRP